MGLGLPGQYVVLSVTGRERFQGKRKSWVMLPIGEDQRRKRHLNSDILLSYLYYCILGVKLQNTKGQKSRELLLTNINIF